jgi:HPt (histidine-containing phosphotransfer) domain-containing protein
MEPLDRKVLDFLRSPSRNGESSLLKRVIGIYMMSSSKLMETLHQAISLGDASAIQNAAHSLKSASGNLGAMALAELCNELESMGRAGTTASSTSLLPVLELEYERVREALAEELKETVG